LRRKLQSKGYDAGVLAALIERLVAEHLLDDRRYVVNFVSFHAARGEGPLRVRAKLRQIGVTGELVEECLAAFPDWVAQIETARIKKFGASLPNDYADRQRQARFLRYRGYTGAQIRAAMGFDTDINDDTEDYETRR
jgi:regulatory protein